MILYHGTNCSIDKIDLDKCRPYKDFGKGFYLTTIREQAEKMAHRVARIYGGEPTVNVYEFDGIPAGLKVNLQRRIGQCSSYGTGMQIRIRILHMIIILIIGMILSWVR